MESLNYTSTARFPRGAPPLPAKSGVFLLTTSISGVLSEPILPELQVLAYQKREERADLSVLGPREPLWLRTGKVLITYEDYL